MKHESENKTSIRSSAYISIKGAPSKSTLYRKHQQLYPTTPIRLGEMELMNLEMCKNPEEIVRFLSMYSMSEENRKELVRHLLKCNPLDVGSVPVRKPKDNFNAAILSVYLKTLGVALKDTNEKPMIQSGIIEA